MHDTHARTRTRAHTQKEKTNALQRPEKQPPGHQQHQRRHTQRAITRAHTYPADLSNSHHATSKTNAGTHRRQSHTHTHALQRPEQQPPGHRQHQRGRRLQSGWGGLGGRNQCHRGHRQHKSQRPILCRFVGARVRACMCKCVCVFVSCVCMRLHMCVLLVGQVGGCSRTRTIECRQATICPFMACLGAVSVRFVGQRLLMCVRVCVSLGLWWCASAVCVSNAVFVCPMLYLHVQCCVCMSSAVFVCPVLCVCVQCRVCMSNAVCESPGLWWFSGCCVCPMLCANPRLSARM